MRFRKSVTVEAVGVERYDQIKPRALVLAAPAFGAAEDGSGVWRVPEGDELVARIEGDVTPYEQQFDRPLSWQATVRVGVES